MTATKGKTTQDLIDRLEWLRRRKQLAEERSAWWLMEANDRAEQITGVLVTLRERGIVDVTR